MHNVKVEPAQGLSSLVSFFITVRFHTFGEISVGVTELQSL